MGYIYILVHKRIPGLVKIGRTDTSVEERVASINTATGVPGGFNVYCSFQVIDTVKAEALIHSKLDRYRFISNKEFFELKPDVAKSYVEKIIEGSDFGIVFDPISMMRCDSTAHMGMLIKKRRKQIGLTQKELATKVGCGARLITEVEAGKSTAQFGKVLEVLKALNLRIAVDFSSFSMP